jgi:hypothetical protein
MEDVKAKTITKSVPLQLRKQVSYGLYVLS